MVQKDMQENDNLAEANDTLESGTDTQPGKASPDEKEELINKLQEQLEEQKDKYLRQAADFDNYRKRTAKEKLELMQTAGRDVISSLLDALDDSERAEKQIQTAKDINAVKEGLLLVFNKLKSILQSRGLRAMETVGTDFNPDTMEAITEIPAPKPDLVGKVVDELEKGYYLNDKIIRFAKVVVGK